MTSRQCQSWLPIPERADPEAASEKWQACISHTLSYHVFIDGEYEVSEVTPSGYGIHE